MSKTKAFYNIQHQKPKMNIFDLTADKKGSSDMGQLTPIFVMDLIPGDKVSLKNNILMRFAPLVAPVMHRAKVYCHTFFVPNRLLWPNWEDFITGGEDGQDVNVWPYINLDFDTNDPGSLGDYLGLPTSADVPAGAARNVSGFPFAAYQKIYNDYYRDQNLISEQLDQLNNGENTNTNLRTLRKRAWSRDYFTSSLPFLQRGPEALLPLQGDASIVRQDPPTNQQVVELLDGTAAPDAETLATLTNAILGVNPSGQNAIINLNDTHYVDLSTASATSIIELRRAFKLQEWLEKSARGGARYIETIRVFFGVSSSDKRLQRAEYLGGCQTPIKISEVLQTSASGSDVQQMDTPQANMAGHGIATTGGDWISYFAEEHGYLMTIMSVMPMSAYQQGIPKHFQRRDKFDYFWPQFQHIGEQAIAVDEIYVDPAGSGNDVFGYTPRYVEYKNIPNTVHGDFRTSLDFWHMGRKFASKPALNQDFIEMDSTEVDRIFAVTEQGANKLWWHVLNEVKAQRPMAVYGNPQFG